MSELLNCPKCGNEVMELIRDEEESIIKCSGCGMTWTIADLWNTWAPSQSVCSQVWEDEAIRIILNVDLDDLCVPPTFHSPHEMIEGATRIYTALLSTGVISQQVVDIERLMLCIAESRDALYAAASYMTPTSTSGIYARKQVIEQIERCQLALDSLSSMDQAEYSKEEVEKLVRWASRTVASAKNNKTMNGWLVPDYEILGLNEALKLEHEKTHKTFRVPKRDARMESMNCDGLEADSEMLVATVRKHLLAITQFLDLNYPKEKK